MKKLLLLLPLLLPACAAQPKVMNISWQEFPLAQRITICGERNIACAKWHEDQKWCQANTLLLDDDGIAFAATFFKMKIADKEKAKQTFRMMMLGHETEHCFLGSFHAE